MPARLFVAAHAFPKVPHIFHGFHRASARVTPYASSHLQLIVCGIEPPLTSLRHGEYVDE
uniref:hypothetical protein n=1 Tax=Vibrio sp. TaxID=678 RepID=UPI001F2FBDFE|nr:hypothetical protein [Vibrio sp.]